MSGLVSILGGGGDVIMTTVIALTIFSALVLAYMAFQQGSALVNRLATIATRRSNARAVDTGRARRFGAQAGVSILRRLADSLKLTRGAEAEKNATLLTQAGWRSREALVVYVGIRLILPCTLTSIGIILAVANLAVLIFRARVRTPRPGAAAGFSDRRPE